MEYVAKEKLVFKIFLLTTYSILSVAAIYWGVV